MKEKNYIKGVIASNFMFVNMSCFSKSPILLSCKEINDAAAKNSLILTTNCNYIFDKMKPNYHQILAIILFKILLVIISIILSATLEEYKSILINNIKSPTKVKHPVTHKHLKGINPMGLGDVWAVYYLNN